MSNSSDEQSIYYNCSIDNQIDGVDNSNKHNFRKTIRL